MTHRLLFPCLALTATAMAEPLYTAPFGEGGKWNLYQKVSDYETWDDARAIAEKMPCPIGDSELKGHLVTLQSAGETQFVRLVAGLQSVWCGLTDNEAFGGHEAANHPRDGWKWVTGEPANYTNWKPVEPDDWQGDGGTGEDAVLFDRYGRWSDAGSGIDGQKSTLLPFIVEWETRADGPVPDAYAMEKVWPEKFVWPPVVKGHWNARVFIDIQNRMPFTRDLTAEISGHTILGTEPWLWLTTPDVNRVGWLAPAGPESTNFPGLPLQQPYIGTVVGKIHVEKPGIYSFAISAEEAFALRIGDLKWKSTSGDGFIDPLDPLTVTQPIAGHVSRTLAVLDLPAGDHLVQATWTVVTTGSELHILSAPGIHVTEGSTADWRPLGHRKSLEKIPNLGITGAGWTVDCSTGTPDGGWLPLQEALVKLELDLGRISREGLASINFADAPVTHPTRFPTASVFPNDKPGTRNDHWPLKATAKLVVPADGTYQIGLHAAGLGALRIRGGHLLEASQTAQGTKDYHPKADSFDFNGRTDGNNDPKIVTRWELEKGEHDIEVFYVKDIGPASLAVFSSPNGPYPPALLTAGGAGLVDDVPGLPLSEN